MIGLRHGLLVPISQTLSSQRCILTKKVGNIPTSDQTARKQVAQFFADYPVRDYPSHRDIILVGDEPSGIYYIESGHVQQYDIAERTGREVTTHLFDPGSFFPLIWGLANMPNYYSYRTITESQLRHAPRQAVNHFLAHQPEVLWHLIKRLLRGLNSLSGRLERLALGSAEEKVIGELSYLAHHLGEKRDGKIMIQSHLTHQNIADLTGLTRETVSHCLEQAAKTGLISYDHQHITIENPEQLEQQQITFE